MQTSLLRPSTNPADGAGYQAGEPSPELMMRLIRGAGEEPGVVHSLPSTKSHLSAGGRQDRRHVSKELFRKVERLSLVCAVRQHDL